RLRETAGSRTSASARAGAHALECSSGIEVGQGLQTTGSLDRSGFRQSGPSLVCSSGTLIMASGPAKCSPLNGVWPVNPQRRGLVGRVEPEADVEGVGRIEADRGVETEDLIDEDGLDLGHVAVVVLDLEIALVPGEAEAALLRELGRGNESPVGP